MPSSPPGTPVVVRRQLLWALGALASVSILGASGCSAVNNSVGSPTASQEGGSATGDVASPPTAPPTPGGPHFSDGTWLVGSDVQAGTYRTRQASPGCYWERDKDLNGGVDSILANDNTDSPSVVTILATDKAFKASNCGTWVTDLSQITSSTTSFDNGDFIVGTDVSPGTYRSVASPGCYWERETDFLHGTSSIAANDNTDNSAVVQISPSDKGFLSRRCGHWSRV